MSAVEPPIPHYDQLAIGSIEARVRMLEEGPLRELLDYEAAHADRTHVVEVIRHRLEALAQGDAQPTGGDPTPSPVEVGSAPRSAPKASPQTEGPAMNPPSQGDPTNPAQPRR
jgi:hypothetical protein